MIQNMFVSYQLEQALELLEEHVKAGDISKLEITLAKVNKLIAKLDLPSEKTIRDNSQFMLDAFREWDKMSQLNKESYGRFGNAYNELRKFWGDAEIQQFILILFSGLME